jgi:hypothetical protein
MYQIITHYTLPQLPIKCVFSKPCTHAPEGKLEIFPIERPLKIRRYTLFD